MNKYPAYTKAMVITDTNTHTGEFRKIVCLQQGIIAALVSDEVQEDDSTSVTDVELRVNPDEPVLEGLRVTSITLKPPTGQADPCCVIAYSY